MFSKTIGVMSLPVVIWKDKEHEVQQETSRLWQRVELLQKIVDDHLAAFVDSRNESIKDDLFSAITKKKMEIDEVKDQLEKLQSSAEDDKERFLTFAFDFVENMGSHFLEISRDNRERCKQIVFPAGFLLDENKKVYTPEISSLIRLMNTKKDSPETEKSFMVQHS